VDARDILKALEARLARLAQDGAGFLNLPPDAAAAAQLESACRAVPPAGGQEAARSQSTVAVRIPPEPRAAAVEPAGLGLEESSLEGRGARGHPSRYDSLEALHQAFAGCTRCGLAAGRTNLVFGAGPARPRLLFVGEGPGHDEDLQGLPFVGRAGQLLALGIQALGLTRDDVYIANVVKCRPPNNRNPEPAEVAACFPILIRQVELLDPALIVVLGNVSLKALNPAARGITSERGRLFEFRGWKALPTYHPAYLLRNPNALNEWWSDLRQAFRMAYGTEP
jgi:DNA polymerase